VEADRRKLGRSPRLLAADAGYYSRTNEEGTQALGVEYVLVPNRSARSAERRQWEKREECWRKRRGSVIFPIPGRAAAGRNMVRYDSELEGTAASFREAHHGPEYSQPIQSINERGQTPFPSSPAPLGHPLSTWDDQLPNCQITTTWDEL
jgi:hypothetical protein